MGLCWFKIEDVDFGFIKNVFYCKFEVFVEYFNMVLMLIEFDNLDVLLLIFMSLVFCIVFNVKENKQEIFVISVRIYEKVFFSDIILVDKFFCWIFIVICFYGQVFLFGFDQFIQKW